MRGKDDNAHGHALDKFLASLFAIVFVLVPIRSMAAGKKNAENPLIIRDQGLARLTWRNGNGVGGIQRNLANPWYVFLSG